MIVDGCKFANINESLVYVRVGNGFDAKRGSKERITGWRVLQDFMFEHGLITKLQARINMIYIRAFVNMPNGLRRIVYEKMLRKRSNGENA